LTTLQKRWPARQKDEKDGNKEEWQSEKKGEVTFHSFPKQKSKTEEAERAFSWKIKSH